MSVTVLDRRYNSNPFGPMASPQSSLQTQVDSLVSHFVEEAASPTTLAAMTAGGMAYRLGRVGVMGLGVGARCNVPLRFASMAIGLGSEVTAFEFTNRALHTFRATGQSPLQANPSNLWSWSGPGGWREGLASSAITFGMLRGAGSLAREQNLIFQHAFQTSAMVAGHNTVGLLGITPQPEGTLAEQFLHAEAVNLQLGAAMSVVHGLAPGLHAFEQSLDLSMRTREIDLATRTSPNGKTPRWAMALAGNAPFETERPNENETPESSNLVFMAKGKGDESDSSKRPPSLPTLLRQVSLFRDVRSVKLSLRALYIGVTGPLRGEILNTLEKIEGGQSHGLLIRDLLSDPRISQTRFLSNDLQRRLGEQIRDLKGAIGSRDSGVFFFNLMRGFTESPAAPKGAPKPVKLTAEALLTLMEVRLQELEKLVSGSDPLPFSTKEALAEGVQLARSYQKIIRASMKQKDRDFLTQLRNRADLDRITPKLERRLLNFMKYSEGPKLEDCVLMLDIDHFKRVNDTYGHLGGDEVLRAVAEILRDAETTRLRDIIVRYGGEEFFIFLFKSGRAGATIAAERIRKIIEEHPIQIEEEGEEVKDGETKQDPIRVTVSIGVAEMRALPPKVEGGTPLIEGSLDHAIKRADMALYAAKSVGRNRVIFSGDPDFDWVTGMLNRTGLENRASELEGSLLESSGHSTGQEIHPWVLKLDIDHLNVINYAYNQSVGNKVLGAVAHTLRETASRANYIAAHDGEDDFFIYLPHSDRDEVLQFAKKIRQSMAEREISIEGRDPIQATVSIGAAPMRPLPPAEEGGAPIIKGSLNDAIVRANRALSVAKKGGRNQVVVSSE